MNFLNENNFKTRDQIKKDKEEKVASEKFLAEEKKKEENKKKTEEKIIAEEKRKAEEKKAAEDKKEAERKAMVKKRSPSITCENQYSKYTDNQKMNLILNKAMSQSGSFTEGADLLLLIKQIDFYKLDARKQALYLEFEEMMNTVREMEETWNSIGIYIEDLCY